MTRVRLRSPARPRAARPATAARAHVLLLALALLVALAPAARAATVRRVTVFAAASLARPFSDLGALLHAERPDIAVRFSFAGSQQLAAQLTLGARADVFASADERWMQDAVARRLVAGTPEVFATNRLVVILPAANPGRIAALADLARPGVKLVLAADAVPVGRYARRLLATLGTSPGFPRDFYARALRNVVSEEDEVRGVVGKVRLGEADAGVVYVSDVSGTGGRGLRTLAVPAGASPRASYPIAVLAGAAEPAAARAFLALVLSPRGQAVLRAAGFEAPR